MLLNHPDKGKSDVNMLNGSCKTRLSYGAAWEHFKN